MNVLAVPDVLNNLKKKTTITPYVEERLKEGHSPFSVATWLQQDLFEFTNTPKAVLAEVIREFFIETVPVEDRIKLVNTNSSTLRKSVEKTRQQTSALEQMEFLYLVQVRRIEMGHEEEVRLYELRKKEDNIDSIIEQFDGEVEKKKGKRGSTLNGTLDNSIETARRMLMDIHKMRQELGFDPKQSDKLEVSVTIGAKTQTDIYKEKRAKIAKDFRDIGKKLLESSGETVDAEFKPLNE